MNYRHTKTYFFLCLLALLARQSLAFGQEEATAAAAVSAVHTHGFGFYAALFQEKPTPCDAAHLNYEFTRNGSADHGHDGEDEADIHEVTLSLAHSFADWIGVELAAPWIVEERSDETERRAGDIHASIRAAGFLAGPIVHGVGIGVGIPVEEDGHTHVEPSYSIGYPGRFFQAALTLYMEIPIEDDNESGRAAGSAAYAVIRAAGWLHLIAEISAERTLSGEEEGEWRADVAAGFRVFPFGGSDASIAFGVKAPLAGDHYDWSTLVALMYHI